MTRNFTRLVCIGLGITFGFVALAQQNMFENAVMPHQHEVELRIGENKWPEVWPDSIIWYSFSGDKGYKQEFLSSSADNAIYKTYNWKNNAWVLNDQNFTFVKSRYDYDPYIREDENKSGVQFPLIQYGSSVWFQVSNTTNPAPKVERNQNGQIVFVEGNSASISVTYNARRQVSSFTWNTHRTEYYQFQYDENGNFISFWDNGQLAQAASYDSQGRRTRSYVYNMAQYNQFLVYHYSDGSSSIVDTENSKPVGNNNQGGFGMQSPLRIDSLYKGSLVIEFPDGFGLDENNTNLTIEFSDSYDLIITKQENNSWLIEIRPKSLRNAALRVGEITNMLQVAYRVDEKVKRGTYNISVNNILFETKGGYEVPEPAITVAAIVERLGVGVETAEHESIWAFGGNLYIRTDKAGTVSVYTLPGQLIRQQTVGAGETVIPLPQGMYFVKFGAGTQKIVVR